MKSIIIFVCLTAAIANHVVLTSPVLSQKAEEIINKVQQARQEVRASIKSILPTRNGTNILEDIANKFTTTTTTKKPVLETFWGKIASKFDAINGAIKNLGQSGLDKMADIKAAIEAQIQALLRRVEKLKRISDVFSRMMERLSQPSLFRRV